MSRVVCGEEHEGIICVMPPDHDPEPHYGGGLLPPDVGRLVEEKVTELEAMTARAKKEWRRFRILNLIWVGLVLFYIGLTIGKLTGAT